MHKRVIDEALIIECIKECRELELEANEDENNHEKFGNNKKKLKNKLEEEYEEIEFTKTYELSIAFRDIYKIDYLGGFENLRKLRLDNNLIETIENLDSLINLEWLDLSFNNISKIEGLDKLTKLKDLCLLNNFIETIENLEHNTNLQILSLGNNCIKTTEDNILYLRQFKHLYALNLKGNPIYDNDDFRVSLFAYCPNLTFLDYNRIKNEEIISAKRTKCDQLSEIEKKESEIAKQIEYTKNEENFNNLLLQANIDSVNTFFDDMIRDDSEMIRLQNLPGFMEKINEYKIKIKQETKKYIDNIIEVYNKKIKEDNTLELTLKKISYESEIESINIINRFQNNELKELDEYKDKDKDKIIIKLKNISNELMELEMQCVEKISFVINIYEDRITDLMKENLSSTELYFAEIQNIENEYHENLLSLINNILETIKIDGIDSVIKPLTENESLRNMIMDKEAINNSITLSHDNHISYIGRIEDLIRDKEEKEKKLNVKNQNDKEYKRNRQRISEILIFIQKYAKQFNVKIE